MFKTKVNIFILSSFITSMENIDHPDNLSVLVKNKSFTNRSLFTETKHRLYIYKVTSQDSISGKQETK